MMNDVDFDSDVRACILSGVPPIRDLVPFTALLKYLPTVLLPTFTLVALKKSELVCLNMV